MVSTMRNIKLSKAQIIVFTNMRAGINYFFNPITNYHPYTMGKHGSDAPMAHGTIINNLEKNGLITKRRTDRMVYIYELTELGKTIDL